jgi:hypothetical protein
MAMRPFGYQTQQPVGGSDWLIEMARKAGIADKPTGSGLETATRFAVGVPSPVAVPMALNKMGDFMKMIQETPPTGSVNFSPAEVQAAQKAVQAIQTPKVSDLGFYSQLEAAALPLQNKGTGSQFLAQIEKTAGVKPEEIKWTGLDEFLKGKQSVTKDEVVNYIDQNRVNLQEVQTGSLKASALNNEQSAANNLTSLINKNEGSSIRIQGTQGKVFSDEALYYLQDGTVKPDQFPTDLQDAANKYLTAYNQAQSTADTPTKFSKWTLPGGENYREILLTLPGQWEKPRALQEANSARIRQLKEQMLGTSGSNEIRAEISRLHNENTALQKQISDAPIYKSGHFAEPNILAHMRVNDRVVDGKKTLFIEEVQSDWHQAGRKKGYKGKEETLSYDDPEYVAARKRNIELLNEFNRNNDNPAKQKEIEPLLEEANRVVRRFEEIRNKAIDVVPDAPFKTTWHELALKRAIQEASEKGYDRIAFTTGQTQAARYDLSKQIDEINVVGRTNALTGEQTKSVALDTINGQSLRLGVNKEGIVDNVNDQSMSNLIGKGLDEVIGKDLAIKIMDGGSQTISGEGLKIGGKGMEGFYDQILPKSLEKLGKKFDAKVGKSFIEGERTRDASGIPSMYPEKIEVWSMDITPKMRESVTQKGQPLFQFAPAIPAGGLLGQEEE